MAEHEPNPTQPGEPRPPLQPSPMAPPPPPPYGYYPPPAAAPASKGVFSKIIAGVVTTVLISSVVLNIYLIFIVTAMSTGLREAEYQPGDGSVDQRIVVMPIVGMINGEQAIFVGSSLRELRKNPPAALILRVESGGGTVTASDQIWHAVQDFANDTGVPVVASFGGIAASGGYYVAAGADHIIAEETCITGSIGVIAQAFTVEELLENVGLTPEVMVAEGSPDKDTANDIFRPWDEDDRARLQSLLDHMYDRFTDVVIEGRGDKVPEYTRADVFDGDIYFANQALDNGLIDSIGYMDDAINEAAKLAGIAGGDAPQVTVVQPRASLLGQIFGASHSGPSVWERPTGTELRHMLQEVSATELLYLYQPGQ